MSEDSDINITSEEEDRKGSLSQDPGPKDKENGSGCAPWVPTETGSTTRECLPLWVSAVPSLSTRSTCRKQEKLAQAPFFPSYGYSPLQGAQPISGVVYPGVPLLLLIPHAAMAELELASVHCHYSWLYVVPLNSHAPGMATPGQAAPEEEGPPTGSCRATSAGGLHPGRPGCGLRSLNGPATRPSCIFPFLSLLPCPPNAQGPNKRCEVRSCPKCFSVLEDVWALYRACQSRSSSPQCRASWAGTTRPSLPRTLLSRAAFVVRAAQHRSVTSVFSFGPGGFQLNVDPSSRLGEGALLSLSHRLSTRPACQAGRRHRPGGHLCALL